MKRLLFWVALLLGLFFSVGTIVAVLSHTAQIADRITIGSIPYLLVGIALDLITNPAAWLGVMLLALARVMKIRNNQRRPK